jgi:hypothetical protein
MGSIAAQGKSMEGLQRFNGEISGAFFINLDLSNLANQGILTGELIINSVQSKEGYKICFGSPAGNIGSGNCFTGNLDNTPFTINWTNANPLAKSAGPRRAFLLLYDPREHQGTRIPLSPRVSKSCSMARGCVGSQFSYRRETCSRLTIEPVAACLSVL